MVVHTHPQIHGEFKKGNFVIHKSPREFSALAIDQAHEQAYAVIKGDGDTIGVTEDSSALRRWMVAGPEVSRIVAMYEQLANAKFLTNNSNTMNKPSRSKKLSSIEKLYNTMREFGNPFREDTNELPTLDTKNVAHPDAAALVADHLDNGKKKFNDFLTSLQVGNKSSFYDTIKTHRTDFFSKRPDPKSKDLKQKNLKDECQLFAKLFISCQLRECDLQEFFQHENQSFPVFISDGGKLMSSQKSQLVPMLESMSTLPDILPSVEVIIIYG